MLLGWLRKAIQITNFMKSFGPLEWVVDVGVAAVVFVVFVVLCLLSLVLVAYERPK